MPYILLETVNRGEYVQLCENVSCTCVLSSAVLSLAVIGGVCVHVEFNLENVLLFFGNYRRKYRTNTLFNLRQCVIVCQQSR